MRYKIIENFGPEDGENWEKYLSWRRLAFKSFDSVDGILRPDLFSPESPEDWNNVVNENYKFNMLTNIAYAKKVSSKYDNFVIVGVDIELEHGYKPKDNLLGYDILDEYCNVSVLTNCGPDDEKIIDEHLQSNGLVRNFKQAIELRDTLRKLFPDCSHSAMCEVWAVYGIDI